jgi:hypothetical protein
VHFADNVQQRKQRSHFQRRVRLEHKVVLLLGNCGYRSNMFDVELIHSSYTFIYIYIPMYIVYK